MRGHQDDIVDEVRSRIDIVDIVSEQITLKRAGKNYIGLCPFHEEDTPSFNVSPDRQMFYCFGCQKGGDVFTFVMERHGFSFRQALEMLADRVGFPLPDQQFSPARRQAASERRRLADIMERAANYFENQLRQASSAAAVRRYIRERGLEADTVKLFRFGWSAREWTALVGAFQRTGLETRLLVEAGLAVRRSDGSLYDRFRGRLMFPIRDERGRVVGFGGRAFGEDQPKYLNSPETKLFQKNRVLYALDLAGGSIRRRGCGLIVEGYMDAVTAHQAGFTHAVASLGTALSEEQARLVARNASRIEIAYDADAAGQAATLRGLRHFARLGLTAAVFVVRLPNGHDPDSFIRERGAAAFQERLDRAQPLVDYVFDLALERHDPEVPENKAVIVRMIAPWWSRLESPVVQSEYVRRFAERLQVDEGALRMELQNLRGAGRLNDSDSRRASQPHLAGRLARSNGFRRSEAMKRHNRATGRDITRVWGGNGIQQQDRLGPATGRQPSLPGNVPAERELLRIMVHHPELVGTVLDKLPLDAFTDAEVRAAVATIAELVRESAVTAATGKPWGQLVFDHMQAPELSALVGGLLMAGPAPGEADEIIKDCVQRIQRRSYELEAEQLRNMMTDLERSGQEVPSEMLLEYQSLQQRLRGPQVERG